MSEKTRLWIELRQSIAPARLKPYANASDADELDALARYYWNMALCEALYPSIQCFEIALRNTMHYALSKSKGTKFWFDDPWLLLSNEQQSVMDAKRELDVQGKAHEPGRIVAELNFGFWTSLFSAPYERPLLLPILPTAFAPMPSALRTRRVLARRVDDIRKLRNRVFHHEPIWNTPDLPARHQEILEAIGWINPRKQRLMAVIDRFEIVYRRGWKYYRDEIEFILAEEEEARTTSPPEAEESEPR